MSVTGVDDVIDPLLLAGLRSTLQRLGSDAFVRGPLIVHDRRCFPDAWTEDAAGVYRACRRALGHAGHPSISVRILDRRDGREVVAGGDLVHLAAVGEGTAGFALFGLAAPKLLLHQIALETGRLALVLAEGTDSPYRDAKDGPRFPKDRAATLAQIALGFGTIALDGSAGHLRSEGVEGGFVVGQWMRSEVGGLPAPACAQLLAAQLVVRGCDELSEVSRRLSPDVRPMLEEAYGPLEALRDALITALGLPQPDAWPEPIPLDETPLSPDPEGEAAALSAERAPLDRLGAPNEGEVAFVTRRSHSLRGVAVGGILGGILGGALGSALPLLAGLAGGLLVGRLVLVSTECSACEARLQPDAVRCSACAAEIVGTIGHRDERLAAEEAYREGLEAEAAGE